MVVLGDVLWLAEVVTELLAELLIVPEFDALLEELGDSLWLFEPVWVTVDDLLGVRVSVRVRDWL